MIDLFILTVFGVSVEIILGYAIYAAKRAGL